MFKFVDSASGILEVTTSGFWKIEEARSYVTELKSRTAAQRRSYGRALVLVDGRGSQVQSSAVMDVVGDLQTVLIAGDGDRAAYVVPNNLAKMQAQRLASSARLSVFLTPEEARVWLLDDATGGA